MARWQYFTIAGSPVAAHDPLLVGCARRDLDGPRHNCELLGNAGSWEPSDFLERYYVLGSNEQELTDVSEDEMASIIAFRTGARMHPSHTRLTTSGEQRRLTWRQVLPWVPFAIGATFVAAELLRRLFT